MSNPSITNSAIIDAAGSRKVATLSMARIAILESIGHPLVKSNSEWTSLDLATLSYIMRSPIERLAEEFAAGKISEKAIIYADTIDLKAAKDDFANVLAQFADFNKVAPLTKGEQESGEVHPPATVG